MTKRFSTKKALIASVLSLALCLSMLAGTTFAWFTDSVTSSNNIIKSGNLDVEMYWADGTATVPSEDAGWTDASTGAIFNYENWEPGYAEVRHIKIANKGSLALQYKVNIQANGDVSELADVIDVYYVDPAAQIATRADLTADMKLGTLTDVLDSLGTSGNGTLAAGEADTITIALKMQETAGNEYQDKAIGTDFSIQIVATQLASETDGFDNQYDKDATYPDMISRVAKGGESLTAGNVAIVLPNSATEDVYTVKVENKVIETNENNETTISLDIDLLKSGVKVEAEENVSYPVSMDIGKGVIVTGVTHKGVAVEDYSYNPSTGILTFTTDSFSPFSVSYSENTISINSADEFISVLSELRDHAKTIIPGAEGDKSYRQNVIFVLENDIVIDANTSFMYTDSNGAPLHFYGVRGVLDLNGHNITVTADALLSGKAHANAVLLVQYSNLSIIGEGSIIANNKSIPVYGWANGTVDIYGGNYVTNASERNESAVYVNNATMLINVYGGTYTNSAYAFNAHDTSCANTAVITLHEGITYTDFLKNGTTNVIQSDLNGGRIAIADGCELVNENGLNKVVKD